MARVAVLMMVATLATVTFAAQINLVTPNGYGVTSFAFGSLGSSSFDTDALFDGKLDTVVTVDTHRPFFESNLAYDYELKVNRYKIYVGEDTDPSWFPKAWTLTALTHIYDTKTRKWGTREEVLDTVTDAQFVNGVYAANVNNSGKYERLVLKITEDSNPNDNRLKVKMAEIKYFGSKGQYDRQVEGEFVCKKAPTFVRKADGKTREQGGVPFSSDSTKSLGALGKLFNDKEYDGQRIALRNNKVIIGYHFPKALTVVQFFLDDSLNWTHNDQRRGILKLEGHTCDPTCDYLGRDGWVSLSRGSMKTHYHRKYLVQRPGSYRAYRIRYDRDEGGHPWIYNLQEVSFLQCAEEDQI